MWFILITFIKTYCVNLKAIIKPICLNKSCLFEYSTYRLDKIHVSCFMCLFTITKEN